MDNQSDLMWEIKHKQPLTMNRRHVYNIEQMFGFVKDNFMQFGPSLIIKSAFLASLLLGTLVFFITAGAASVPAEGSPVEQMEMDNLSTKTTSKPKSLDGNLPLTQTCEVNQRFPKRVLRWCETITQYAKKNNLPVDLVAAMIWQESGGNPAAYSPSGAVGLMQVMPSDGLAAGFQCNSGPCFANRPSTEELKDPEFNIKIGTRMLANLVQRHGNVREALMAYGPTNVGYSYADKVLKIYKQYGKK